MTQQKLNRKQDLNTNTNEGDEEQVERGKRRSGDGNQENTDRWRNTLGGREGQTRQQGTDEAQGNHTT